MTANAKDVILFKNKGSGDEDNAEEYELELQKVDLNVIFIPTLAFEFLNLEMLIEKLNAVNEFSGLILTSQRSIEAISQCLTEIPDTILSKWKTLPCFVIGPKSYAKCKLLLNFDACGQGCGNAEALIPVIAKRVKSTDKPLFFPCGDKKISTITRELPVCGIQVKELTVYKTLQHKDLEIDLLKNIKVKNIDDVLMVFFSPSGLQYVLSILTKYKYPTDKLSCISIGPSTSKAITAAELRLCCTAEKPIAASLVNCIKTFLKELSSDN